MRLHSAINTVKAVCLLSRKIIILSIGLLFLSIAILPARAGIDASGARELIVSDASAHQMFGESVAIDGDVAVVGAWGSDIGLTNAGAAYVFHRNQTGTSTWAQCRRLVPSNSFVNDQAGRAVSVDGDVIAVGAWLGDVPSRTNVGYVAVYYRNQGGTNNWGEQAFLAPSETKTNSEFGRSLALDGDLLAVGAPERSVASGPASGEVYVFERSAPGATSAWTKVARLVATDGNDYDYFGVAVALDGDVLVVGAPNAFDTAVVPNTRKGAVYIFERNASSSGTWAQVARLQPTNLINSAEFGASVSLLNGTLVVGSPETTNTSGSSYVFVRSRGGTNAWQLVTKMNPSDTAADQDFGRSVDVAGDTAFIAAPGGNFVYAFQRDAGGDERWGEVARIAAPAGVVDGDEYGGSVAGQNGALLVGVPGAGGSLDPGKAYLYSFMNEEWIRSGSRSQNNREAEDRFGYALDVDGSAVVVGAPYRDVNGANDAGAVYLFERGTGDQIKRLVDLSPEAGDLFGFSIAIDGDAVVVGAPFTDSPSWGPDCGWVHVYQRAYDGSNTWSQVPTSLLPLQSPVTNNYMGSSVDISGDTVIVGLPGRSSNLGRVDFYARNNEGTNTWRFFRSFFGSGTSPGDQFGSSVAIDGDVAIVGAPGCESLGCNGSVGTVFVFQRSSLASNDWREARRIPSPDTNISSSISFGRKLALSGDTALVHVAGLTEKIYVFERDHGGSNRWGQAAVIIPSNTVDIIYGGVDSLHLDQDVAVVGSRSAIVDGNNWAGAAWVFERNAGGSNAWGQVAILRDTNPAALDGFGFDVAVSGQTLLVGIPDADPNSVTNAGRVAVFGGFLYGPPRITSLSQSGSVFSAAISTQPAWRYTVQGSLDLMANMWISIPVLSDVVGATDGSLEITHTNLFEASAYRVLREEP